MSLKASSITRSALLGAACLGTLLSAPLVARAAPASQVVIPAGISGTLELVNVLEELVDKQFIYPATSPKRFNGAIDGLNQAIHDKKLAPVVLAKANTSGTRKEAEAIFDADYREVASRYPVLLKDNELQTAVLRGMLKVLDDPYTVYLTTKEYDSLKEAMSGGDFGGLGVYLTIDKATGDTLTVGNIIENTPAARADLRPGDQILEVDHKPTKGTDLEGASRLLRGEVGSPVVLTIRRPKVEQPFDVDMKRDRIIVSTVKPELLKQDGHLFGYLKLSIFGEYTDYDMEKAIRELEAQHVEGFILDVRNNGGGYINAAIDVCSKFLPTGSRVVSVEEHGQSQVVSRSHPNIHPQEPLVMLVNQYSASASEITAGAMKDLHRAKLVGVKTFGKGSVQKIFPLPDGSAIKITVAHYHTPSGKDIHKLGIDPDFKVEMPANNVGAPLKDDPQMQKAVSVLESEIAPTGKESAAPGTTSVSSSSEEMAYLDRERSQGFKVVSRRFVRNADHLIEEVQLQGSGGSKTLRFDVSSFLQ